MPDKLAELVVASLFFFALPYFWGFSYLSAYFGAFGLSMAEIGVTQQEIFVATFNAAKYSGGDVLKDLHWMAINLWFWAFLLACSVLFVLSFERIKLSLFARASRVPTSVVLVISFLVLAIAGSRYSAIAGERIASLRIDRLPRVVIVGSDANARYPSMKAAFADSLLSVDYDFLLYANQSDVFVLRRNPKSSTEYLIRVRKADEMIVMSWEALKQSIGRKVDIQ